MIIPSVIRQFVVFTSLILCGISSTGRTATVTLAENGKCGWTIAVASPVAGDFDIGMKNGWAFSRDSGFEKAAADELASLIRRITGTAPDVFAVKDASDLSRFPRVIAVGSLAIELGAKPPKSTFGIDGSVVDIRADRILLAGETPIASYFAFCRLAEMLGCRWYMPGKLGEIIPKRDKLELKTGRFDEVPVVWSRYLWLSDGPSSMADPINREFNCWMLHNRQYGTFVDCQHLWRIIIPSEKYYKDHPEWYALIKGKRSPAMLCTSNEEMTRQFIENYKNYIRKRPTQIWFSLSQDDGFEFCECGNCKALDPGLCDVTTPNLPQITDRLVDFYNKVVTELVKEFPDRYFSFLAYVNSTAPPVKEKLHPHLMPVIAPITYSRFHAINASNSESMRALGSYFEGWNKASEHVGYYTYAYNLADCLLPYTREHQVRSDIPFLTKNNLEMVCAETINTWENLLPWYYLMAKLNIDPKLDSNAVVSEFYTDFFGPAAKDMKAYMDMLDSAYAKLEHESGAFWLAHRVFTPEFIKKADRYLSTAEKKAAGNEIVRQRIAMWRHGFACARLFVKMRNEINSLQFEMAAESAREICTITEKAYKENPYSASSYAAKSYFKPVWPDQMEFCASRLKCARILYKFPDEWYAFIDPSGIGEAARMYDPDIPLTKWRRLKTYSATIAEQGIERFRGTIWYRSSLKMDNDSLNKKVHILFAGVDSRMELYINGQKAGSSPTKGCFDARDFDITSFLHEGENTVVCAVGNEFLTEIDTGGIMRPVVVYIPND